MIAYIPIPTPVYIPSGHGCRNLTFNQGVTVLFALYFLTSFFMGFVQADLGSKINWKVPATYLFFPYVLGFGFNWVIFAKWRKSDY